MITKEIIKCFVDNSSNWFDIIPDIIMAITGVVNLVIVIYFYKRDKKDSKQSRKNDYKLSWFNSMEFSKLGFNLQSNLENFKNLINSFSKDEINDDELKNKGKEIEGSILNLKSQIVSLLKAIDAQKVKEILSLFIDAQDEFIDIQAVVIGNKSMGKLNVSEINSRIESLKTKIIKCIYQAGNDLI